MFNFNDYIKYFIVRFSDADTVAIVLLSKQSARRRLLKVSKVITDKFTNWLKHANSDGYNIYASASRLKEDAKTRKKEDFHPLQKTLWIELDFSPLKKMREWEMKLPELPLPNIVVSSSIGKFHLYWILDKYISKEIIERINKKIAGYFRHKYPNEKIDSVHDISRVLRIPGFKNHKNGYYTRLHWIKNDPIRYDSFRAAFKQAKPAPTVINNKSVADNHTGKRLAPLRKQHTSKSEQDMKEIIYFLSNRLKTPSQCIAYLKRKRKGEKSDIVYYANTTMRKAEQYLQVCEYKQAVKYAKWPK